MNVLDPISTIMTSELFTLGPKDKLIEAQKIFDSHRIHHIPVVVKKEILGMISQTDLLYFLKGKTKDKGEKNLNDILLKNYHAEDIMTSNLAKLASTDRIGVALKIFKENLFHAIPIVDDGQLVGIISSYDIIAAIPNK